MTPMSEEALAKVGEIGKRYGFTGVAPLYIEQLYNEVHRLRTLPPDVAAAIGRYAKRLRDDTVSEYCIGDLFTIAAHFTALFQKGA